MSSQKDNQHHSESTETLTPYTMTGVFSKDQRILHPQFGIGTVTSVQSGKVKIRLDTEKADRVFLCAKKISVGRGNSGDVKMPVSYSRTSKLWWIPAAELGIELDPDPEFSARRKSFIRTEFSRKAYGIDRKPFNSEVDDPEDDA